MIIVHRTLTFVDISLLQQRKKLATEHIGNCLNSIAFLLFLCFKTWKIWNLEREFNGIKTKKLDPRSLTKYTGRINYRGLITLTALNNMLIPFSRNINHGLADPTGNHWNSITSFRGLIERWRQFIRSNGRNCGLFA